MVAVVLLNHVLRVRSLTQTVRRALAAVIVPSLFRCVDEWNKWKLIDVTDLNVFGDQVKYAAAQK